MSFSSLPPELVHQIIESTVPHKFHTTTYQQRQRTLCSLSLVSRLFKSIAQPLLFEIVKLNLFEDATKLSTARALGGGAALGVVRSLVIDWVSDDSGRTQEEEERFAESLQVAETARNLTLSFVRERDFAELISMTSHHLKYLHLTDQHSKPPESLHLPHLHSLTLYYVSSDLVCTLVDPSIVPNLRNLGLLDDDPDFVQDLIESKLNLLLPQLVALTVVARIWRHPLAAFLHSAASRILVHFSSYDTAGLDPAAASLVHVRLRNLNSAGLLIGDKQLEARLEEWSSIIQNNPSLSLKSFYLDSSLRPSTSLPQVTQASLKTFTRICQERKIDLVFEPVPVHDCDPIISSEFVRRQKEERRRETVSQAGSGC
ncbi:hypothetical protein JCM5350_002327 [Sporobolomyces pararoseus]